MNTQIKINGLWVDGSPSEEGQDYRIKIPVGDKFGYEEKTYSNSLESILVTVSLDKTSAKLEDSTPVTVGYTIKFSEEISSSVDVTVPISITDRNNAHVDNIGLEITANTSTDTFTGSFTIDKRGDFTVTNEAINFHSRTGMNIIIKPLKLTYQPWVRIYQ